MTQHEKVIIFSYQRGVTTDLLDVKILDPICIMCLCQCFGGTFLVSQWLLFLEQFSRLVFPLEELEIKFT